MSTALVQVWQVREAEGEDRLHSAACGFCSPSQVSSQEQVVLSEALAESAGKAVFARVGSGIWLVISFLFSSLLPFQVSRNGMRACGLVGAAKPAWCGGCAGRVGI